MNPLAVILGFGVYYAIRHMAEELPRISRENDAINAMPAITKQQQAAKHQAVLAARHRRQTGGK